MSLSSDFHRIFPIGQKLVSSPLDFLPMHRNGTRGGDRQPNTFALNARDSHDNPIVDDDRFSHITAED